MIGNLLVTSAALAQVAVPVTRVPPRATLPSAVIRVSPGSPITARVLPDLVVSDIRIENDETAWVRVLNQGSADAVGAIMVTAWAHIASSRGNPPPFPVTVENLAAGQGKWVKFGPWRNESTAYGSDPSFPLMKASGIGAAVDPPVGSGSGWLGPDPLEALRKLSAGKPKCDDKIGCIRELNEDNNYLGLEGAKLVYGAPDPAELR